MVPKETLSQLGPYPFQLGSMDWAGWEAHRDSHCLQLCPHHQAHQAPMESSKPMVTLMTLAKLRQS